MASCIDRSKKVNIFKMYWDLKKADLKRYVVGGEDMISADMKECVAMATILKSELCKEEIRKSDEHEIVIRISQIIGAAPCNICKAEEIFNLMKYEIARYIISHEFCLCTEKQENLILWLDEKTSPTGVKQLVETIEKYLK